MLLAAGVVPALAVGGWLAAALGLGVDVEGVVPQQVELKLLDELAVAVVLLFLDCDDEVIARRVGMSERTFRRHVATIMARPSKGTGAKSLDVKCHE